jgi:FdhE protein
MAQSMPVTDAARLLSPEEIAVLAGTQIPYLRLPERASVFADRALRLRQLAAGHAMRDYLLFIAELADAQQALLMDMPPLALPSAAEVRGAALAGQAPLPAEAWPRDPAWRNLQRSLLARVVPRLAGNPALAMVRALQQAGDDHLEQQADRLLGGMMRGLDLASAPIIAAALQVVWTHLVLETQRLHGAATSLPPFGRTDDTRLCPCCASLPTAGITRIGAETNGYRYLHCALCSTQWHLVRIKCSHCGSTKGIHYHGIEALQGHALPATAARPGAVQAEGCEECGHYLKIVHMEKDMQVEPVADDLASLTLDLLVAETGLERHGVNLLLLFGEPGADDEDANVAADAVMHPPDPRGA